MPLMAKKEPTMPVPIRLPMSVIKRLDAAAAKKFESRAGMGARLIIEGLERNDERSERKR